MKKISIAAAFTLLFAFSVFAQRQAEVTVTSTYLRKAPDFNAEKLRTLQKGERVTFEQGREAGGWTYVSTSDGSVKGWILANTIQAVKSAVKTPQTPARNPPTTPQSSTQTSPVNPTVSPSPTTATPEVVENDNEVLKIDTEEV